MFYPGSKDRCETLQSRAPSGEMAAIPVWPGMAKTRSILATFIRTPWFTPNPRKSAGRNAATRSTSIIPCIAFTQGVLADESPNPALLYADRRASRYFRFRALGFVAPPPRHYPRLDAAQMLPHGQGKFLYDPGDRPVGQKGRIRGVFQRIYPARQQESRPEPDCPERVCAGPVAQQPPAHRAHRTQHHSL
jgi:hypothetical protein